MASDNTGKEIEYIYQNDAHVAFLLLYLRLPCSAVTYALLGSYTVQSELGDFDIDEFGPGTEYIRKMRFAPHQDRELLKKIAELHRTHK